MGFLFYKVSLSCLSWILDMQRCVSKVLKWVGTCAYYSYIIHDAYCDLLAYAQIVIWSVILSIDCVHKFVSTLFNVPKWFEALRTSLEGFKLSKPSFFLNLYCEPYYILCDYIENFYIILCTVYFTWFNYAEKSILVTFKVLHLLEINYIGNATLESSNSHFA